MVSGELNEGLQETLAVFETTGDAGEPLTTAEVADRIDVSRRSTYSRLEKLVDTGHLGTKKVGARGRVWWRPPAQVGDADPPGTLPEELAGVVYRCRNERGWPMEFVGGGCEELTGYEAEGFVSGDRSWGGDLVHPEDREHVREAVADGLERRGKFSLTYRIRAADGRMRWVWERGRALPDGTGEPSRLEGFITDVTELKRQSAHLESEIEEVFQRVDDAFYALDEDWQFTYTNDTAAELLGRMSDDLIGEAIWEAFPEAVGTEMEAQFRAAMESQESVSFERSSELLDIVAEVRAYPSETGLSVYISDVTERKERSRELERTKERYRSLAENFPNGGVGVYDEDLRYTLVTGTMWDDIDPDPSELEGETIWDALPAETAEDVEPIFRGALEGDTGTVVSQLGGRTYRVWVTPLRDAVGEIVGGQSFALDVTDQLERERQIVESERRYRILAEYFPNGIVTLFDHDLRYELAAGQAFQDIPVDPGDVEGNHFADVWDDETAAVLEPLFEGALDGEERSVEVAYEGREWLVRVVPITDDRGDVFAGMKMAHDITDRKERERSLEDAKSQLEAATEAGAVGTWEWRVQEDEMYTGRRFARLFGVDPDLARDGVSLDRFVESIHEDDRDRIEAEIAAALDSCGAYEAEYRVRNADDELRWVSARGRVECDADGEPVRFPGALTDITERKRAELELQRNNEQLEALFEVLPVGILVTDADGKMVSANDTAREIWGGEVFDADSIEGYDKFTMRWADSGEPVVPEETTVARVLRGQAVTEPQVYEIEAFDGDHRIVQAEGRPIRDESGEVVRGVVTFRDVTERTQRERDLEMFETVARTASDVIVTIDTDSIVQDVNPAVADVFGYDPDELVGESLTALMPGEFTDDHLDAVSEYLTEGVRHVDWDYVELPGVRAGGTEIPLGISFSEYEHGDERYFTGIIRDIGERKERERELVRQRTQLEDRERTLRRSYEVIGDGDLSFAEKIDGLLEVVSDAVDSDYGTLSRVNRATGEYVFESIEAPADADLEAGDTVPLGTTNCERAIATEETLVLDDVEADAPELADRAGNADWGISSYLGAPVMVDGETYGTFCFYGMEPRAEPFSDWAVTLIDLLSNWVGYELERRQHADQLAALNSLNEVVREITEAVVEQPTRDAIEETVCANLAAAESYEFVWIGEVDPATDSVEIRAEAEAANYLEAITISVDPDDERGQGPMATSLRTGEIQTTNDVQADPDYEPWREAAVEHGVSSSAAIPIVHEGTVYGVLNVYASRRDAFEGQERAVIEQLGEVVGHAIAAVDRKRALMSDEVVELQFRIPDVFDAFGVDASQTGRITLDQVVPVADDEFLVYGSATADARDDVAALIEAVTPWDEVTFHDEDGETTFELRFSEPPVLTTLASLGGSVEEVVIEDGDYDMTLQLSPSADSRRLIEAVQEAYPVAEMMTRRQITRTEEGAERMDRALVETLTDRQLTALRAAYYAGFFEWPRDTSGEGLAASLDVSAPTFHQHLRKAEKKVFDELLGKSATVPARADD